MQSSRTRLHLRVDFVDGAVEFDEQEAFAVGVAGVDRGFGGEDGGAVHHLHRGGKHAGGDDVGDGLAGGGAGVEGGEESLHALRAAHDAEHGFGGDAECAFAADEDAHEVVAGCVGHAVRRAEPDELAGGKDDLATEHVRGGEAVLEAVCAAGVFGEIAADGADDLRGGVGRVEEAGAADELGDLRVGDAGFDGDESVFEVDGGDAVHAREADDDAAGRGQRAAAESGAGAACDEGDVVLRADADRGLDLRGGRAGGRRRRGRRGSW